MTAWARSASTVFEISGGKNAAGMVGGGQRDVLPYPCRIKRMTSENRIPVIIVGYRNPQDVVECVQALGHLMADPAFDVWICENGGSAAFDALVASLGSADGPCDQDTTTYLDESMLRFVRLQYLRLRSKNARVIVAEARENLGYGGAINAWLRVLLTFPGWCGVWILNPDTQPRPGALAELVAWSAVRQLGMVGSRIVRPGQPEIVVTRGLRWRRMRATTKAIDRHAPAAVEPDPEAVEAHLNAPSGVSIYVTRQCLKQIGFMDEEYFLYFEDLDWGYRAMRSCGVGYAHRSVVVHRGGTTIGSAASRSKASPFSVYLDFRNRVNFVRRHHRSWMAWTVLILVLRSFEYGLVGAFANMGAALCGLKAGIAGETGRPDRIFDFDGRTPRLRRRPTAARDAGRYRSLLGEATKQRVKIAIALAFYLLAGTMQLLRRGLGRPTPHRLVILYYHGMPAALRTSFARQLDMLSSRVSVVPADYHGAAAPGGKSVAITFDDAFTSVLENALPELRARQMPATIFVPAGSLGRPPAWEAECASAYSKEIVATADALRTQISDLVNLGAHSLTHPHLTRLPPEQARAEIAGCREQMRDIFGIDTRIFAFPYGDHDRAAVELCREAGYQRVFTNIPDVVDPVSDQLHRGRILVDPADGLLEFYLKMSGAYAWMGYIAALKTRLRTFLRRS